MIDLGPGGGPEGGRLVAEGPAARIVAGCRESLTGRACSLAARDAARAVNSPQTDSVGPMTPRNRIDLLEEDRFGRSMRRFSERIEQIGSALARDGALAFILIDGAPLERIERSYGVQAHRKATEKLARWFARPVARISRNTI